MRRARLVAAGIVVASACVAGGYATTSQQVVTVNPEGYAFGEITIGDTGETTLTLSPRTLSDDDTVSVIGLVTSCPDFAVDPGALPARVFAECDAQGQCAIQAHRFTASFTPRFPGEQACIAAIDGERIMLAGTGVAAAYALEVTPDELEYGDNRGGTPLQQVTVTNRGAQALTVSAQVGSAFTLDGSAGAPHVLPAGASEAIGVRCPASPAMRTGTLDITTAEGPAASVVLSCRSLGSGVWATPAIAGFATTTVGSVGPERTIMISAGSAGSNETSTLSNFRFAPGTSPDVSFAVTPPASVMLGSSGSYMLRLRHAPTVPGRGPLGMVLFDTSSGPRRIAIAGDARLASIGASPAIVELGPLCAGSDASRDVELYANSDGDLAVTSIVQPAVPFAATATTGVLQARRANTLTVTASIAAAAPGDYADRFVVMTDSPTQPTLEVPVRATALPPGVASVPDVVRYGVVAVGTTTEAIEVAVANCGGAPIDIVRARIEGRDAGDFAIVSPVRPGPLAPNGQQRVLVVMTPRQRGPREGSLVVEHSGGSVVTPLEGFGGGDPLRDRESYYGCGASHEPGLPAMVMAVAGWALARRRRWPR